MKKERPEYPADADLSHLLSYWAGPEGAGLSTASCAERLLDDLGLTAPDLEQLIREAKDDGKAT